MKNKKIFLTFLFFIAIIFVVIEVLLYFFLGNLWGYSKVDRFCIDFNSKLSVGLFAGAISGLFYNLINEKSKEKTERIFKIFWMLILLSFIFGIFSYGLMLK